MTNFGHVDSLQQQDPDLPLSVAQPAWTVAQLTLAQRA
jgi:hypothetical protein